MDEEEFDKNINQLRQLLKQMAVDMGDYIEWGMLLYIIQEKLSRKPPSLDLLPKYWYDKVMEVRNNAKFRKVFASFKSAYDFHAKTFPNDNFWIRDGRYEEEYNEPL